MPSRTAAAPRPGKRAPRQKVSVMARGLQILRRGARPFRPLESAATRYYILGDGSACRMAAALRHATPMPATPAISIDPIYKGGKRALRGALSSRARRAIARDAWPPRPTRRVAFAGEAAERYRLRAKDLAGATDAVVLAHCAHTSVAAFVSRLRAVLPRRARLYAVCVTCHFPGLRRAVRVPDRWQLLCPPGSAARSWRSASNKINRPEPSR